jgi:hypothetical protein
VIIVLGCCTASRLKYNLGLKVVLSRLTQKRRRGTYILTVFMALEPCIQGFKGGCRPYLSIDSTILTSRWNGCLASATALDGHNWMFPVPFGLFQSESEENWEWFMRQLHRSIGDVSPLAISTDACKGLANVVWTVFPHAKQRE